MSKEWTDEEITFLKFAYPNKDFTIEEVCAGLNRTKSSITSKASILKLERYKENIPDGFKKCTKCCVIAPLNEFHNHSGRKDGKHSWCKYCKSKVYSEQADAPFCYGSTNTKQANVPFKLCKECGEEKPIYDFYKNKRMKDGYVNICKLCESNKARKRYIKGGY